MNKKILWITQTAVMLALLVALQALTKPMGQLEPALSSTPFWPSRFCLPVCPAALRLQ